MKNIENKFKNFAKSAKVGVDYVVDGAKEAVNAYVAHPVRNTLLTAAALGYMSCSGPTTTPTEYPNPTEQDTTAPEISINGDNPYSMFVGDSYIDEGASATDNVDGSLEAIVSYDNVDSSKEGNYVVDYMSTDSSGNVGEATRNVKVDTETGLAEKLNTIVRYEGSEMKASEALAEMGFSLNRGIETENIEGEYLASGDWEQSNGSTDSFTDDPMSLSSQSGFNINYTMQNSINMVNPSITGSSIERSTISSFLDISNDGVLDYVDFANFEKQNDGSFLVDYIRLTTKDNPGSVPDWTKSSETWDKQ